MSIDLEHSLADFYFPDGDDPLVPPADFAEWMDRGEWAAALYEPKLLDAVGPEGRVRRGGADTNVINLSSYNYLGLAKHPEVIAAAVSALQERGTGACGSPLLSGMADLHGTLQTKLASFVGREDCMLFNSGFAGGMGTLAGLLRKGDVAILDAKCHLCLLDGAKLAKARVVFFDHNSPDSLDQALAAHAGKRRLVVVEGVYSMDGDTADLPALLPVTEKHGVGVFVDEAHSILVYGEKGRGIGEHYDVESKLPLQFATFSKSFSAIGGFTAGSKRVIHYLRYYTNAYGFSCALPPSVVAGLLKALEVATRDNVLREKLWSNTNYFREQALGLGLNLGESTSQVIPIVIGSDRQQLYELCLEMNQKGLFLAPVDYPSVPEDQLRYRVAVTAAHTKAQLDRALQILEDTVVKALR